ncbi:hypothetical protein L218DRAFT_488970 [Marasmius fiardii PR-910]|nr:hypothetical protein L218DRAFT_488970 [Marasmius fiardii PR-910]
MIMMMPLCLKCKRSKRCPIFHFVFSPVSRTPNPYLILARIYSVPTSCIHTLLCSLNLISHSHHPQCIAHTHYTYSTHIQSQPTLQPHIPVYI